MRELPPDGADGHERGVRRTLDERGAAGGPDAGRTLDPEDAKLVTLARATRARTGAPEGAAVRDGTGRTYSAATVALASLGLTALEAAVAAAVSSGAGVLEAAAVVTTAPVLPAPPVLAELRCSTYLMAAPDGMLVFVERGPGA